MTDKDILISDLNDISEILNNNGYGGWCASIRKAVALLKEQEAEISFLKGMQLQTVHNMSDEDIGNAVAQVIGLKGRWSKGE